MLTRFSLISLLAWITIALLAPGVSQAQSRHGNRFAGEWAGPIAGSEDAGFIRLEVERDGDVEGTVFDRTQGRLLRIDGNVTFRGWFTGTLTPEGEAAINATGAFENASGGIDVRFFHADPPGTAITRGFLRRVSNNQRPAQRFAGEYRGSFEGLPTPGEVRLEIEGDGDLEGRFAHPTVPAFSSEFEGHVGITGDFVIAIRAASVTTIAVGRLDRHGNDLSATFSASLNNVVTTASFSARRLHGDDREHHPGNNGNGNGHGNGNGQGSGNGGGSSGGTVNIAGDWTGTARVAGETEAISVTIAQDGALVGAIGDRRAELRVNGSVNDRGGVSGTLTTGRGTVTPFRGALRIENGRLVGVMTRTIGARRFQTVSFSLTQSANP